MKIKEILSQNKILPLATICSEGDARNIATKLIEAQCPILEITLRDERVRSILHIFQEYSGLTVGLGTIRSNEDIDLAINNKLAFGITPGFSPKLCGYAQSKDFLIIPGIQSASEIMQASEMGYSILKFFPASALGPNYLKAVCEPFPGLDWLATGGISVETIPDWIAAGVSGFGVGGKLTSGGVSEIPNRVAEFKAAIAAARGK